MNRSRLVLFLAMSVVVVGVVAGLGALWMSSAHAAVGPLAGEALILPKDARFVMGFDVKRFAASPFYERFATRLELSSVIIRAPRTTRCTLGLDPPAPAGSKHR